MEAGAICNRAPVFATPDTSIRDVALLMREHHVGDVVVVEERGDKRVPVGMLTDRDIVVETIALGVPVDSIAAGDIMSRNLVTVTEDTDLAALMDLMSGHGVRRVPVLSERGTLVGVVSADTLLGLAAESITELHRLIVQAQLTEAVTRD